MKYSRVQTKNWSATLPGDESCSRCGKCLTKMQFVLLSVLFCSSLTTGAALKILRLDVPNIVDPRWEKVSLKCEYDLGGKDLYTITWFKDGQEIFRYMPGGVPKPKRVQNITDLYIDLSRSDSKQVTLLGPNTHKGEINLAGSYGCEVSSEAPSFETDYREANMSVAIPPKSPPILDGMRPSYKIGEILEAECTSGLSYPPAVLTFILNGKEVNRALTKDLRANNVDGSVVSTTRLGLTLRLERHHFPEGRLTVMCRSSLPGVANGLVSHTIEIVTLAASNQRLAQEPPKSGGVSRSSVGMFHTILICWIVVAIHIRCNSLRFLRV